MPDAVCSKCGIGKASDPIGPALLAVFAAGHQNGDATCKNSGGVGSLPNWCLKSLRRSEKQEAPLELVGNRCGVAHRPSKRHCRRSGVLIGELYGKDWQNLTVVAVFRGREVIQSRKKVSNCTPAIACQRPRHAIFVDNTVILIFRSAALSAYICTLHAARGCSDSA